MNQAVANISIIVILRDFRKMRVESWQMRDGRLAEENMAFETTVHGPWSIVYGL
jgi:hypothetical protein